MKTLRQVLLVGVAMLTAGGSAWGHHSFAMFDLDKEVTLAGVVKVFKWENPHCWLDVIASDGKGGTTDWSMEMGAQGMLSRTGWKRTTLKAGDKVTVVFNPLKDGAPSGRLVRVTLPNGKVMGPGGPPLPPPKPAPKPAH